jgi:transcriptional regulator with XRE-family HTH domain
MKPYAVITSERRAKVEQARYLQSLGLAQREIAARMGVGRSTVSEYLHDPWRQKAARRRQGYQGICASCGKPTAGDLGPGRARPLCIGCIQDERHANRRWQPETILVAIRAFAEEHGRPPTSTEWLGFKGHNPAYPYFSDVQREFGKWAEAIERAGFPRPQQGNKTARTKKILDALLDALVRHHPDPVGADELADDVGLCEHTVRQRLRELRESKHVVRTGGGTKGDPYLWALAAEAERRAA